MADNSTEEVTVVKPSTSQLPIEESSSISADISDVEKKGDVSAINQMAIQSEPVEFVGMGKEELMTLANHPFWVRLRWALFISFWLVWMGLLVGAGLIIGLSPGCEEEETMKIASSSIKHNR